MTTHLEHINNGTTQRCCNKIACNSQHFPTIPKSIPLCNIGLFDSAKISGARRRQSRHPGRTVRILAGGLTFGLKVLLRLFRNEFLNIYVHLLEAQSLARKCPDRNSHRGVQCNSCNPGKYGSRQRLAALLPLRRRDVSPSFIRQRDFISVVLCYQMR